MTKQMTTQFNESTQSLIEEIRSELHQTTSTIQIGTSITNMDPW